MSERGFRLEFSMIIHKIADVENLITFFQFHRPLNTIPTSEEQMAMIRNKRGLVQKLKILRSELAKLQTPSGYCRIEVTRQDVFEDSYREVMSLRVRDLRKRLMIKFQGEEGLDYGGVAREWLYLLSHEMLNPYYGLFQYSREDIYTLEVNPNSSINPDHISYFYFVGRIVGMAIFHGHYIDAGFTLPFYKQLLGRKCTVEDMENVDPAFYKSMKWILENDVSSIFEDQVSFYVVKFENFLVCMLSRLKLMQLHLYVENQIFIKHVVNS